jgi:phosphomannomutase
MTSFTHAFDPTTLREYDIRGIVGKTLSGADAFAIGRVFGSLRRAGGRQQGGGGARRPPVLAGAGAAAGRGADGVRHGGAAGGLLPDADALLRCLRAGNGRRGDGDGSHNPPDYNGFKSMIGKKPFYGKDIQELGACRRPATWCRGARLRALVDIAADYVARMMRDWDGGSTGLNVVWDPGNGSSGEIVARMVQEIPGTHTVINGTIDGTFPAHHPDPTVAKNLEQIIAEVKRQGADLGIAFDGDGDRIGVVDGEGHILFGDQLLVVLARDVLTRHPGGTIIADVKASQVLFDEVAKAGGTPLMWKTGHSLIKAKMAETGAPLAGEMSGHIFFADKWYGFDDAPYPALRLLGILARGGSPSPRSAPPCRRC